jgi:hypothetical protein
MRKPTPDFKLRLPPELRAQVDTAAFENNRSVNSEIVARLEQSFRDDLERQKQALETIQASATIRTEKHLVALQAELSDVASRLLEVERRLGLVSQAEEMPIVSSSRMLLTGRQLEKDE